MIIISLIMCLLGMVHEKIAMPAAAQILQRSGGHHEDLMRHQNKSQVWRNQHLICDKCFQGWINWSSWIHGWWSVVMANNLGSSHVHGPGPHSSEVIHFRLAQFSSHKRHITCHLSWFYPHSSFLDNAFMIAPKESKLAKWDRSSVSHAGDVDWMPNMSDIVKQWPSRSEIIITHHQYRPKAPKSFKWWDYCNHLQFVSPTNCLKWLLKHRTTCRLRLTIAPTTGEGYGGFL